MTDFYRYPLPVEKALTDYRQKFGNFPTHWVINTKRQANAAQAAAALGLDPHINTSGGCLAGEVWLNIPGEETTKGGGSPAPVQLTLGGL